MEDMIANLETDIVAGAYEIFNKVSYFLYPRKISLYQSMNRSNW